jgi:phage baseplate assembly protein W
MEYVDFTMNVGDDGKCVKVTGVDAAVLAIRNILLSKPGNFPFTPSLGMDIAKYQFDLLDDATLSDIRAKLLQQINQFVPALDNIVASVDKVEEDINGKTIDALGISVSAVLDGEEVTTHYLVTQDDEEVHVYNETQH